KPVIASDLDGIPEAFAVGNYGQLVPAESVEALSHAMLFWASQPRADLARRLALHDVVAKLVSLERMASDYARLYMKLQSENNPTISNEICSPGGPNRLLRLRQLVEQDQQLLLQFAEGTVRSDHFGSA